MSEVYEFRFRRGAFFTGYGTIGLILITVYFLWRIGQTIAGSQPQWVGFVAGAGIVYVWYMRLAPVKTIVMVRDGGVIFIRGLGRREVQANDIKTVRPWLNLSRRNFILKHAYGSEFLFDDPTAVAAVVRELVRLNPGLLAHGIPSAPEG